MARPSGDGAGRLWLEATGDDVISSVAGEGGIDGGAGRHTVDGGADEDRCVAERMRACEIL